MTYNVKITKDWDPLTKSSGAMAEIRTHNIRCWGFSTQDALDRACKRILREVNDPEPHFLINFE